MWLGVAHGFGFSVQSQARQIQTPMRKRRLFDAAKQKSPPVEEDA